MLRISLQGKPIFGVNLNMSAISMSLVVVTLYITLQYIYIYILHCSTLQLLYSKNSQSDTRLVAHATKSILKPGFHYPSWRPELTGDVFPLPSTRAWRVMETGHLSTRAVNSGSGNRALQFLYSTQSNNIFHYAVVWRWWNQRAGCLRKSCVIGYEKFWPVLVGREVQN